MAQPFAVDGAMKFADLPFTRADSDFFTPRTRASVLIRTQRSTLASSPCSSGICQWLSTSTRCASGNRARISRPLGSSAAAGST
jgi:hypothetical protein